MKTLEQRFWSKVDIPDFFSCWLWTAYRNKKGYGQIRADGLVQAAHRVSWQLTYGPIPNGMWVLHRCDNPPCVNPTHLMIGTHKDNMADMVSKGRQPRHRGETHPMAILTEQQVRDIRSLADHGMTQTEIGYLFGVTQSAIWRIINNRCWRHVK